MDEKVTGRIASLKNSNVPCSLDELVFFNDNKMYFTIPPDGIGGYILYGHYFNLYELDLNAPHANTLATITTIFEGGSDFDFNKMRNELVYSDVNNISIRNLDTGAVQNFPIPDNIRE